MWKRLTHENLSEVLNHSLSLLAELALGKQAVHYCENERSRTDVVREVVKTNICISPLIKIDVDVDTK